MAVIILVVGFINNRIFDDYGIRYRFLSKILKKRWLYEVILWFSLLSSLAVFVLAWFFPGLCLFVLGGVWIGTVGELLPLHLIIRSVSIMSYKQAYDIYVTNADYWEKNIEKQKKKRMKRKIKKGKK